MNIKERKVNCFPWIKFECIDSEIRKGKRWKIYKRIRRIENCSLLIIHEKEAVLNKRGYHKGKHKKKLKFVKT